MNPQAMRFRLGVFVLAALLLLAVMVSLFGTFPTFFKRQNQYTIRFADAPGVDSGSPVRRSGVRIGEVKSITLDNDTGDVRVEVVIDRKYTIRHNEEPTLIRNILGGDTSIDFIPKEPKIGVHDNTPINPGEELVGKSKSEVETLLTQASKMLPTTETALNAMSKSLAMLERMAPSTEKAIVVITDLSGELRDTNREVLGLAKDLRKMLPDIAKTNETVQELVKATRDTVPELKRTNDEIQISARNWGKLGERLDTLLQTNQDKIIRAVDNLNDTLLRVRDVFSDENQKNLATTLRNVKSGSENLDRLTKHTDDLIVESQKTVKRVGESMNRADEVLANLQQATKPMAERGNSVMRNLDESTDKLNKTLTDVREMVRTIGQADGTLKRLLTDPAIYNHLDDAVCQVAKTMPRLDRIMKDLEVFADELARHPEKLGIGGVVRPSSGIKEPAIPIGARMPGH